MSMMQRAEHRVLGPWFARWLRSATRVRGELPRPGDEPRVFAPGPDPDRILLIGGGLVRGYGVMSHDLALGGHLARRVAAASKRGVELDVTWRPMMSMAEAAGFVAKADLSRVDALVVLLGSSQAVSLLAEADWQYELDLLMAAISEHAPSTLPVLFVAIPHVPEFIEIPQFMRVLVRRRVDELNQHTRAAAEKDPRITFVALPTAQGTLARYGDAATYDRWAAAIAPALQRTLASTRPVRPLENIDETARQQALDRLKILDSPPDERFDRIARTARDLLAAEGASILFVDHDRCFVKSLLGRQTAHPRRDHSFADATIQQSGAFVISDGALLERFGDNPWVLGETDVQFYAGYPIESPDGFRVGALGIVDIQPRTFTADDERVLRDLTLSVQALLWADARG
ncbi:hypothetical protein BH11ACT3_BH11ACT3_17970 [soil metagenome]